jgi:two-component system OmpR family sensor kinase
VRRSGHRRKRVPLARRQTDRLALLVDGLLDVSRIATGRVDLELETFDLGELLRETADGMAEQAARAGSAIHLDIAENVVGRWDRTRIDQAITNLLSNAVKYGRGNPVSVSLAGESDRALITVVDRGLGIAREDLDRIFGRFERAVSAKQYGGLGLGLYIVREVITAHGGTIAVRSEPGEGAEFTISLPLTTRRAPRPE